MLLAFAAFVSSDLTQASASTWQSCILRTAEDWSSMKVDPKVIVDASIIHCRRELDDYMISETIELQSNGVSKAEAEKTASGLAAVLLQMIRGFAIDAVARGRKTTP